MVQIKIRPKNIFTRHLARKEAQNVMIRQMSNNKQCEKKKILKSKVAVASNTSAFEFWIMQTDSH